MRYDIRRFSSVTSTMDVCRGLAEQGAPEGVAVLAEEQTAGRGRAGRSWYSPAGQALYLSLLLRPSLSLRRLSWLTMIGALAVLDALDELHIPPSRAGLKWANDVLLDGRKLAGILVEAAFAAERLEYAVLGIGLNVNTRFEDAPAAVRAQATSLQQAMGRPFDLQTVLDLLLAAFDERYAQLPASPLPAYVARLETLDRRVCLRSGDEELIGIATRVEDDGTLIVSTSSGERRVAFGDLLSA